MEKTKFEGEEPKPERTLPVEFGSVSLETLQVHTEIMKLHVRALACHSECLGMNADNFHAATSNEIPPYSNEAYVEVMQKWELVDKEGEVII